MKRLLLLLSVLLLAACGSEPEVTLPVEIDEATGLPLNPDPIPQDTEFIVEGVIRSMNLTPQTSPEFVISAPSGKTFRIRSQGITEIFYADGEGVTVDQIAQGMAVRATVAYQEGSAGTGNAPIMATNDLMLLRSD